MKIVFLRPAENELDEAFKYYESMQEGLGFKFQAEVAHSLSRIVGQPLSYQEIGKYSRRCLVHKFPYGVIYQYKEQSRKLLLYVLLTYIENPIFGCLMNRKHNE